jgi:hypothetical protein
MRSSGGFCCSRACGRSCRCGVSFRSSADAHQPACTPSGLALERRDQTRGAILQDGGNGQRNAAVAKSPSGRRPRWWTSCGDPREAGRRRHGRGNGRVVIPRERSSVDVDMGGARSAKPPRHALGWGRRVAVMAGATCDTTLATMTSSGADQQHRPQGRRATDRSNRPPSSWPPHGPRERDPRYARTRERGGTMRRQRQVRRPSIARS